uniref:transposase n=1 Tax=Trinickia mobilis TaxID=2816356 RepID=UPI001F5CCBE4
ARTRPSDKAKRSERISPPTCRRAHDLGLVPRQSGTAGRVKLLGISKRGDVYLRTLLNHGARSVPTHSKHLSKSLQRLLARRPFNVVVVALANKMARMIWVLLAPARTYQPDYVARAA